MRKILYPSLIAILIAISFGIYVHSKYDVRQLWQLLTDYRYHTHAYHYMNLNIEKIADLPSLPKNDTSWFSSRYIISHSGGGVRQHIYTNSLEAWEYSYSRGTRIFDADCTFTTDSVLVLRHSWDDNFEQTELAMKDSKIRVDINSQTHYTLNEMHPMDYETFIHTPIHKTLTPQSCSDMFRFMQEHEDLYVAVDSKGDVQKTYNYLFNLAHDIGDESLLDRIVVSIYNYSDYNTVLKVYPFKNFAMRIYSPRNYYEMAKFCVEHQIYAVNISKCYIMDEGVKELIKKGLKIYVAVTDYPSDFNFYRDIGIHGCVSNWLHQQDFQ